MATGTGLDAQIGFGEETTVGTAVTVDHFNEFNSESLQWTPTFIEPQGLRADRKFKRVSRVVQSRKTVEGDVEMEFATRGMGLLVAHMLGSSAVPTQIATTTAYSQIHVPGDFVGKALTVQVGRPEPSGTVRPHTFRGCKIGGWSLSVSDGATVMLNLTFDGWDEATDTALVTASYTTAEVFNFAQATLKLGGTASTTAGEMSVSGGTAVTTVIRELTISGETPMATERFGIGNAGVKKEQLENDVPTITGSMSAEYNRAELYDLLKNNTTTALQLTFTGSEIEPGQNNLLDVILPAVKLKSAPPSVEGPDIVAMSTDFEAYDDETNAPIQVKLVSADTTL